MQNLAQMHGQGLHPCAFGLINRVFSSGCRPGGNFVQLEVDSISRLGELNKDMVFKEELGAGIELVRERIERQGNLAGKPSS
jgi:hypothetical protein